MNKKFRAAQKVLDRESAYVAQAAMEVEKLISEVPTASQSSANTLPDDLLFDSDSNTNLSRGLSDGDNLDDTSESNSNSDGTDKSDGSGDGKSKGRGPKGKDVSKILGVLVERLATLKRKVPSSLTSSYDKIKADCIQC